MLADLFTNPDRFFREKAEDDGLVRPALVVAVVGILGGLGAIPILQLTFAAMPEEVRAIAGFLYVLAPIGGLLGAAFFWVLYAGAFHLVSAFAFDGDGSFQRTLAVTGWGFAPGVVGAVLSGIIAIYAVQSITPPSDPAQAQAFAEGIARQPLFLLSSLLGAVFLLWQAFLWTFGVHHSRGITLRDAAITVAVPVTIELLWQVSNLV